MTASDPIERKTLRAINLLTLLATLIVWGLAGWLIQRSHALALNNAKADIAKVALSTEAVLNRNLVSLDTLLADVAIWVRDLPAPGTPHRHPAHASGMDRLLKAALNQNLMLRDVVVLGPGNEVLASARPETARLGMHADAGFIQSVRQQMYPTLRVSGPVTSDLIPERILYLARSTRLANGTPVVVAAAVRAALLSAELDPRDPTGQTTVTLETEAGVLLAAYPLREGTSSQALAPALPSLMSDAASTTLGNARFTRESALLAVRPLLYSGLLVSASQSERDALAIWRTNQNIVILTALALTVMLLAAGVGGRRHVQRLAAARHQVALVNTDLNASNQALQRSVALVQATLEATADAIVVVNQSGQVVQFNDRFVQFIGLPAQVLMGGEAVLLQDRLAELLDNHAEALKVFQTIGHQPDTDTLDELHFRDGRVFLRHSTPQLLHGQPTGRVWSHQDITAFRQAEQTLRAQQTELNLARNELAATLEALPDLLFELDETGLYLDARTHNPGKMVVHPSVFMGQRVADVIPPDAAAEVMASLHEAKLKGSSYGRQIKLPMRKGTMWFELSAARKQTPASEPARFVVVARDITERKANERLIWNQAHYDTLTGLPNRRMFREALQDALQRLLAEPGGQQQLALMFVDLDRFKEVNDTHGHDVGDLLLQQAAQRIQSCVRESDLVARLGGDEFTLMVCGQGAADRAPDIASQLLLRLAAPFELAGETEHISASVGVTICPDDGHESDELIKQADQAMYAAKRAGRNRWERFSPAMQEAAQARSRIARDLRTALAEQQLRVVYQPIVDLQTGLVRKAEALLRWQHPVQGPVSPGVFIPIAEEIGLIHEIGHWVFEHSARQVKHWRQTLHPDFQLSINESPAQFRDGQPGGWTDHLASLGLPGSSVVLEITEGLLVDANPATHRHLNQLHANGIQIALDDFGTGYSSLSYLHEFDLHYLKIDRAFVRHMETSSKDLALCKATIAMAHAMGLRVIAEGIETPGQQRLLTEAGCDFGQGYLFAQPMDAASFETWAQGNQDNRCRTDLSDSDAFPDAFY